MSLRSLLMLCLVLCLAGALTGYAPIATAEEGTGLLPPQPARATRAAPTPTPDLQAGVEFYRELYCGACHALDAAQTAGRFGPPHNGMGSLAHQRVQDPAYGGAATTAAEYLRGSIVEPDIYVVPGTGWHPSACRATAI